MTDKLEEIKESILGLSVEDFESKEEYRKYIISLYNGTISKLKEGVEEVLNEELLEQYVKSLMDQCYLALNKLPPVPEELKVKERSKSGKKVIKQVIDSYSYPDIPELIKNICKGIVRSSSISELRSNIRLWQSAQVLLQERDRLKNEVRMLDEQITFDTKNEELLKFYIQQNKELTEALTKEDEEYLLAKRAHKLHSDGKGRPTIAKELNITERKVRTILDKYEFNK